MKHFFSNGVCLPVCLCYCAHLGGKTMRSTQTLRKKCANHKRCEWRREKTDYWNAAEKRTGTDTLPAASDKRIRTDGKQNWFRLLHSDWTITFIWSLAWNQLSTELRVGRRSLPIGIFLWKGSRNYQKINTYAVLPTSCFELSSRSDKLLILSSHSGTSSSWHLIRRH